MMLMMKGAIGSLVSVPGVLLLVLMSIGCGFSDIRTERVKAGLTQEDASRGRAILEAAMEKSGGIAAWKAHRTAEATMRDDWPSMFMRPFFMPWPENKAPIRFQFLLGTNASRLEFLEGSRQGEIWGIQNWSTYEQRAGEPSRFEKNADAQFFLPTFQWFFEAPFRLPYADIVTYAGEGSAAGRVYDLVFATWNKPEPQEKIDQYLVWVNQETGLIDFLQYTVRDMMRFARGTMQFTDYRDVQGIKVAFNQTVVLEDEPDGTRILHQVILSDVNFGVDIPRGAFYPDPAVRAAKHN
ncbi:MAG: hypothetical protein Q8R92_01525 [Deltaproteobacteria bacterium]|nr:hypothetical protein [Deltaproteobacteria bacterium]